MFSIGNCLCSVNYKCFYFESQSDTMALTLIKMAESSNYQLLCFTIKFDNPACTQIQKKQFIFKIQNSLKIFELRYVY